MPITRDDGFPAEAAALMAMMNQCCEGFSMQHVLMASANMLSAAIHTSAAAMNMPDEAYLPYLKSTLAIVERNALENWRRQSQPTDVPVKSS